MLFEKTSNVADARGFEIGVRADDRMMVRVRFGVHELGHAELDLAVRPIFDHLAALVADDVALKVEFGLVDLASQRFEAIGFEPKEQRQERGWTGLVVVGEVRVRPRVVRASGGFHPLVERLGGSALRAHEHQMLEEVRESRAPRDLVLRPDSVKDVGRDLGQ